MADQPSPEQLKSLALFRNFTDSEREQLASLLFQKKYERGATLFVEGMTGEVLYIVFSGRVEIFKRSEDGQEKRLALLTKGETVGEMSLVDQCPRTATARVAEEAVLFVMTKKAFLSLLERYPPCAVKLLIEFLKIANERLRRANEAVKNL